MALAPGEKKYGLSFSQKQSSSKFNSLAKPLDLFSRESNDEDETKIKAEINQSIKEESKKKLVVKQTQLDMQKALIEDPTVYQYDEIYEELEAKKVKSGPITAEKDRKPKYITGLLKSAEARKREQERRQERKIQKEREKEGDEFDDKEAFVTGSYRKKMQELEAEEERQRKQDELDAANDVTKQKDLSHFYRNLLEKNVSMGGSYNSVTDGNTKESQENSAISKCTEGTEKDIKDESSTLGHHGLPSSKQSEYKQKLPVSSENDKSRKVSGRRKPKLPQEDSADSSSSSSSEDASSREDKRREKKGRRRNEPDRRSPEGRASESPDSSGVENKRGARKQELLHNKKRSRSIERERKKAVYSNTCEREGKRKLEQSLVKHRKQRKASPRQKRKSTHPKYESEKSTVSTDSSESSDTDHEEVELKGRHKQTKMQRHARTGNRSPYIRKEGRTRGREKDGRKEKAEGTSRPSRRRRSVSESSTQSSSDESLDLKRSSTKTRSHGRKSSHHHEDSDDDIKVEKGKSSKKRAYLRDKERFRSSSPKKSTSGRGGRGNIMDKKRKVSRQEGSRGVTGYTRGSMKYDSGTDASVDEEKQRRRRKRKYSGKEEQLEKHERVSREQDREREVQVGSKNRSSKSKSDRKRNDLRSHQEGTDSEGDDRGQERKRNRSRVHGDTGKSHKRQAIAADTVEEGSDRSKLLKFFARRNNEQSITAARKRYLLRQQARIGRSIVEKDSEDD